jgi:hypothetical protein
MLRISLWVDFYIIHEDQVFVIDMVDTNLTPVTTITNVISWLVNVVVKLSVIVKICKYKKFHEGHHFISMTIEVCNVFEHNMYPFIKECACLFHSRQLGSHLSLYFNIQFFKYCVSIALQHVLIFTIKRKIVLTRNACSKPSITIRSRNLHANKIKKVMGEIASYHKRD